MAGLKGPRSTGTHGEVPLVPFLSLENLESSVPHKLANAIIGKKFSYSCFEHSCVRSGMKVFLLRSQDNAHIWSPCPGELEKELPCSVLCTQLGISRRMRAFLPVSLITPPGEFMISPLTQLQPCPLEPRAFINLLHTSECCWGGSAEFNQLTVQAFWNLIKFPEIQVAGIA